MHEQEFATFIRTLAEASGDVIRPYFANADLEVELKGDQSPVTRADRDGEAVMRELIHQAYPQHGILGEEFGPENTSAEFVWVLDPIDGTISFARGCPLFGTLIGLLHNHRPILGAIHQPILKQLCVGDNTVTTLNDRPVQLRQTSTLSDATLLATDIKSIAKYQTQQGFDTLLGQTRLFRTWGDCYGYLLLACGGADIMLDPIMNPWDILPLIPVIQGAKGVITTWSGNDAVSGNSCVAANQSLHPQVIRLLNAAASS
jgi:myo-inositol-1(or 4)-monophosphatase